MLFVHESSANFALQLVYVRKSAQASPSSVHIRRAHNPAYDVMRALVSGLRYMSEIHVGDTCRRYISEIHTVAAVHNRLLRDAEEAMRCLNGGGRT